MENMLTRKAEDYLEAILNITEAKGYARVRDIALVLKIKPPSVIEMVKKLDKKGFVVYKRYDGVALTPEGEKIGRMIKYRHDTIKAFLEIIKVPRSIAEEDACTMEHNLDPKTIEQIKNLVEFVNTAPDSPEWLKHFEIFYKTGEHRCEERGKLGSSNKS
jgi:DtxR family Mn-dependent transcriptional regulator